MASFFTLSRCTTEELQQELKRRENKEFEEELVDLTIVVFDGTNNYSLSIPRAGRRKRIQEITEAFMKNRESLKFVIRKA